MLVFLKHKLGLQKQNDSIFASFAGKNIQFDRVVIMEGIDEQEHLRLLNEEKSREGRRLEALRCKEIRRKEEEQREV